MRPVKHWATTTLVQVEMMVYSILDVNEKSQTVSLLVSIHMIWENEFLKWNSSQFCGIDELTVPRSMLWIPDITIEEDISDRASVQESPYASLDPNGWVHVNEQQQLSYSCQLDLFRFPFDLQQCNITFSSMSFNEKDLKVIKVKNDTFPMQFEEFIRRQGEWKLINTKVTTFTVCINNSSSSKLVYTVMLQRKPFLYVINLIMPLLFLLILDLASFFISEARGERLGFKVTILLSIFVLLLILKDILPSTEENMPIMAIYCLSVFTLVWISVLETMLIGFIANLDGSCGQKSQSTDAEEDIELEVNSHNEPAGEGQVKPENGDLHVDQPGDKMKGVLDNGKTCPQKAKSGDKEKRKATSYKKVAKILDIVFFVLYLLSVVTFQICSFVTWMQALRAHGL
ncbi:5-hydroxytryptamine receptor 3A-like isoform X2 [Melanotaenia boesemani]|nr:5-hydroxytryptamine receptor 3A-like isoform X2 [Melanotaenia boesemani]